MDYHSWCRHEQIRIFDLCAAMLASVIVATCNHRECPAVIFYSFPIRLKGADVEILLIRRGRGKNGADLQPPELKEFWEELFKLAGTKNVIWIPL